MTAADSANALKARILLVEDHPDTAHVISRLLEKLQYQTKIAGSLGAARRLAQEHEFDLLICDIRLPDGSGLELMRELRLRFEIKGIAMSGLAADEDLQKSKDAGFDCHLTKPVDFQTLRTAVEQMLA